jgi:hypothetical protein
MALLDIGLSVVEWIGLAQDGYRQMESSCERGNEPSSSSSSSSSLARQPFVSPGLPQNYLPFFLIVRPSGCSFFGFLNNLIFTL